MNKATLVLVRPDPNAPFENAMTDEQLAIRAASAGRCWVVLLGPNQDPRERALRARLQGEAKLEVYKPPELATPHEPNTGSGLPCEPNALAKYLIEAGIRIPLKRHHHLVVHINAGMAPPLLAAVVEAAAVYPGVDVALGDTVLTGSLRWETRRDRFRAPDPRVGTDIAGNSPAMEKVREQVSRSADQPFPVLILGELGTDTEAVANLLHEKSSRTGPKMAPRIVGLPTTAADSLLFGEASGRRKGRIAEADNGTVFIEDIFRVDPEIQGRLVRALDQSDEGVIRVEPAGSTQKPADVHARFVASSDVDPRSAGSGIVRNRVVDELYYRVAAGVIELPPLRGRLEDLTEICEVYLRRFKKRIDNRGVDVLRQHKWLGNDRELRLVLLRAIMDGPSGASTLSADALRSALRSAALPSGGTSLPLPCRLATELKRIEVATMKAAEAATKNRSAAGRLIGMGDGARNFHRDLEAAAARLEEMENSDAQ